MGRGRFILAVIVGLLAIAVAINMGPKAPKPVTKNGADAPVVEKKVKCLVAKMALQPGTKLNETLVEQKEFPEAEVEATALKETAEVTGKETTRPIEAGQKLTQAMVKKAEVISGLSYDIPKGKRAMTIKVDEITGVGGFIQQGDLVDVVGMFMDAKSLPFTEPVKTILIGVPVLAVGYDFETGPETPVPGQAPPPPAPGQKVAPGAAGASNKITAKKFPHVTIAVASEEAEILTLVADKAKFRLLLRSSKDKDISDEELRKEKESMAIMTKEQAIDVASGKKIAQPGQFGNLEMGSAPGPFDDSGLSRTRPTDARPPKEDANDVKQPKEFMVETFRGVNTPIVVKVKE